MSSKRKTTEHFIWLEQKTRKTDVWLSLSRKALQTYLFLRSKTIGSIYGDSTTKDIKMPYSIIMKETRQSKQQVRDALLELDATGFIDLIKQGGMKSGGYSMNIYRLSKRFMEHGTPDFKEGTMKRAVNVNDRGWGAWRKKQDSSMKKPTGAVRKNVLVAKEDKKGVSRTGTEKRTCSRNSPVRKNVQSIDIPCSK